MAIARMPEAFYDPAAHHRPPEQAVGPVGGRPPIEHRRIVKVLWVVPATGRRREDVPPESGCSGRTAHRSRQRWEERGCWDRLPADLLRLLRQAGQLDPDLVIVAAVTVRAFGGGELTGPSPVARGEKGSKHAPLVDRHGVPLAIRTAGADASDHRQIIPSVLDFPKVTGKPGRPKARPDALYADRGVDSDDTRWLRARSGIEPPSARRRTPHGGGPGKIRWVVERTISGLKGRRRRRIRYGRLAVIQDAWDTPAACVICFRLLHDDETPSG
jgi:transposase